MAGPLHWCHLNGQRLPLAEARISPLDRSFLFGDGIYEVMPVYGGRLFRPRLHFDRLARSAAALRIAQSAQPRCNGNRCCGNWSPPMAAATSTSTCNCRAAPSTAAITRRCRRCRRWCSATARPGRVPAESTLRDGLACITAQDTRWARCDIKSVALLANVMLRQLAVDAGANETILLRDGELMEASASTVHVVRDGVLLTPPNSTRILPGTSRIVVEELADELRHTAPRRSASAKPSCAARTKSGWRQPRAKCSR